jgi:hypothetical protein
MFHGNTTTFIKPLNYMKHALTSVFLAVALGSATSFAQPSPGGGGGTPGLDLAMAKLFGEHHAFTAKSDCSITPAGEKKPITMQMDLSMLDGKSRSELDMTTIKGGPMPPNAAAMMKQMGMDKMVTISRPDKKVSLLIYPGLQSYAELPMTGKEAAVATTEFKIEKKSLGKETIDSHPCEKNKVTMTDDKGEKRDAVIWNASDMKDFPVQMQMTADGTEILMTFKDVKFEKPAAKLFEAPSDFTKYDNVQTMMQTAVMKRMGSPGGQK